jgi:hypothetical protein
LYQKHGSYHLSVSRGPEEGQVGCSGSCGRFCFNGHLHFEELVSGAHPFSLNDTRCSDQTGNVLNQLVVLFAVGMKLGEHSHSVFMPASRYEPPWRIVVAKDQQQNDLNRAWHGLHENGELESPVSVDIQGTEGELSDAKKKGQNMR